MLSKEDRVLIKMLRVEKGYGAKRLIAEFPRRNWSLAAVKRLLQKIDLWVMLFKIHISVKSRRIYMKLCSNVCNRCRLVCVKFYLKRSRFAVVVAKCQGAHFFGDTRYVHCSLFYRHVSGLRPLPLMC